MAKEWQNILDNFSGSKPSSSKTSTSPSKSVTSSSSQNKSNNWQNVLDDFSGSSRKKKYDAAIAPVASKVITSAKKKEKKKWYKSEVFDDGYDFGDVTKAILGISDDTASLKDLTVGSLKKGYYNAVYGEESFKAMNGGKNQKDAYAKILEGDEYQFAPGNDAASAVSGAMELIGQQFRQFTNPSTLALTGTAATMAAVAGQAGPQALLPEEVITVPAAATAAFAAGSAKSNLEIEAGHAYNEMLESGISEDTARKVATAVGTVNAGLELLQVDELLDAYKVTKASGATKTFTKRLLDELVERGIDVGKETMQEVAQEGVTIAGTQLASKRDKGEYAYTADEVKGRLGDTAKSSALSFGLMNVPATAKNTASIISDQKKAKNNQKVVEDNDFDAPIVEEKDEVVETEKPIPQPVPEAEVAPDAKKSNVYLDWMIAERDSLRETLMERQKNNIYDAETERLATEFNKLNSKIASMEAKQAASVDANVEPTPVAEKPVTTQDKAKKHFRDKALDYKTIFDNDSLENVAKFKAVEKATLDAQEFISKGTDGVKSVSEIFGKISTDGKLDAFEEYLHHMLNVDRSTLDQRYGMENRAVFDKTVEESQQEADRLLEENPEFKQAAEDVYAFNNYVLDMRVKGGKITQEQADLFRELYPHYVPISRSRHGNTQDYSPLLEFMRGETNEDSLVQNMDEFFAEADKASESHKITSSGYDFNPLIDTMVNQAFVAHWSAAMNENAVAPTAPDGIQSAPMPSDSVAEQAEAEPDKVTVNTEPAVESARPADFDSNKLLDNRMTLGKVLQEYILENGFVFEKKSKASGNRQLEAKWHANRNAFASAQHFIGHGKGDVRAVTDIVKQVKKSGLQTEFYSYLGHLRNMDGMSLQSRYGVANNRNFMGRGNTFAKSTKVIKTLEQAHPEFKALAEDVYKNVDHLLDQYVERGMITRDDKAMIKELYPHYIPMRYSSKGSLDGMLETLAQFTNESFGTWAMNDFGIELKNTLNTEIHSEPMNIDAFIRKLDSGESLFDFGEEGEYKTFTVYENGEVKTFDIDREMYMALHDSHSWMNMKIPVLHQVNEGFRKFCTEWNIFFSLKNGVKDPQDIMYNSQHPVETYAELTHAGEAILFENSAYRPYYEEYLANGGEPITYFDSEKQKFTSKFNPSELVQYATGLKAVTAINDRVEKTPRLAEYIASRKAGKSVQEAMLDSARVTTNFAAGGKFTKFLNRNGCTFLNASVQGALQHTRNFAESATDADGKLHFDTKEAKIAVVKGTSALIARGLVAGMAAIAINDLRWKDDEDYEDLPDYVKDGYYLLFKYGDGQFFRLPKGRTNATIEKGLRTVAEESFGDDNADWNSFFKLFVENIAPNNPATDNIFAPIREVGKGETWYGEDMIPYRLKNLPTSEQYDEKTDTISVGLSEKLEETLNDITLDEWLEEKLDGTMIGDWLAGFRDGLSPKEINYLLNSYTGVLGDLVLPRHTPKAESPYNDPLSQSLAPLRDIFTTDSVLNSRATGDFYETLEAAEAKAKSGNATADDKLKSSILIGYNVEISDLYDEQRRIQTSDLSDSDKYKQTREIKKKINELQEQGLKAIEGYSIDGKYAESGDKRYNYDAEDDTWWEVKPTLANGKENPYYIQEKLSHENLGMSYADFWNGRKPPSDFEGKTYYGEYDGKRYNYDVEDNSWYEIKPKTKDGEDNFYYQMEQSAHKEFGISYEDFWNNREAYIDAVSVAENWGEPFFETAKNVVGIEKFSEIAGGMADIKADKDANGEPISGSRKKKMKAYIYGLDIPEAEKHILFKAQYPYTKTYNRQIVDYLNGRADISYSEMKSILEELGAKVDDEGYIKW